MPTPSPCSKRCEWRGCAPRRRRGAPTDHLSHWRSRSGGRPLEAGLRLDQQASALDVHRDHSRVGVQRPVDHLRQSPRRVGERRERSGERRVGPARNGAHTMRLCARQGGSRSGPSFSRCGMERSSGWWVRPNGWKNTRTNWSVKPRSISIRIPMGVGSCVASGSAHARKVRKAGVAGCRPVPRAAGGSLLRLRAQGGGGRRET